VPPRIRTASPGQPLRELFQRNEPELDFGLYRIMRAKSGKIGRFIDEELTEIIDQALAAGGQDCSEELKRTYETEFENAGKYGSAEPENAPAVKEAKSAYDKAQEGGDEPAEIDDHLYRLFSRYHDNGDFLSRRGERTTCSRCHSRRDKVCGVAFEMRQRSWSTTCRTTPRGAI